MTVADRMRSWADDYPGLYAHLARGMADDWEAGGALRRICRGWADPPAQAVVQLRLLAGLFRIVLTGRAPQLVPFYACLGGTASADGAWAVARPVVAAHEDELHDALRVAPQTNEPGRSTALLVGLSTLVRATGRTRIRLLEPGASAGLGLLVDRYRFTGAAWAVGPVDSPLVVADAVEGAFAPQPFEIVDRRGCDPHPIDPGEKEGRLRLTSFVWPWQLERHERLASALGIAAVDPPRVDRASAAEWLEAELHPVGDDVLTVVWHSISRQHWPADEAARVDALLVERRAAMPLGRVAMEFPDAAARQPVLAVTRPDGHESRLGTVGDHGVPVRLGG